MNTRKKQFQIYLKKHFRLFFHKKGWSVFLISAMISLAVSYVQSEGMFIQNISTWQGITVLISACIWIGIFNSIQSICKERDTIKHEHRTGLHMSAYFFSHVVFQTFICLIEAIILLVISSFFLNYPEHSLLLNARAEYFITFFLTILCADILGLMISSIVKSSDLAMTIMPFLLILELIFSGAFFTIDGPLGKLSNVTICQYGMRAACISADYNNLESTEKRLLSDRIYTILENNEIPVSYDVVSDVVEDSYEVSANETYTYTLTNLLSQWGFLLCHMIVCSLLGILVLEFVDMDKR